jgi:hypothetical protein
MGNKIVPETDTLSVAEAAIAWEIARLVANNEKHVDAAAYKKYLINTYIEAFKAINTAKHK